MTRKNRWRQKVNSGVVENRVTMKLGSSVITVGTETVLVLCCVPLHHFISLGTAGGLVEKWAGIHFGWGGWIYTSSLPSTQTVPFILFSSQLWTSSQFSWQGGWAWCPQCLCGAAVRCWAGKLQLKALKAFLWSKSSPKKIKWSRNCSLLMRTNDLIQLVSKGLPSLMLQNKLSTSKLLTGSVFWCKLSFSCFRTFGNMLDGAS